MVTNLFWGFNKATTEDIITQVALLRTMTMPKIVMPYGQKAAKSVMHTANTVSNYLKQKQIFDEPKVEDINEKLEREIHNLNYYSRQDLDRILRQELAKRVNLAGKNYNDETLSVAIIEEAAKHKDLNIDKNLTPAQKADSIYRRFAERMLSKMKDKLKTENTAQTQQTTALIEYNLQKMSYAKREELKQLLQVDELTGKTVRSALLSMKMPALFVGTSTIGGFGSFIALSTIIHAVFTTTLGITLPFAAYTTASSALSILTGPIGWSAVLGIGAWQVRKGANSINQEMLAQAVFFAITAYGKQLAPLNEDLPSWVPTENVAEREKIKQNDLEIQRLIKERDKAVRNYEQQINQVNDLLNQLNISQASLKQAREEQLNAKDKINSAKQQQAIYANKIKDLEQTLANNKFTQNNNQQKINQLNNELQQLKTKLQGNQLDFQLYQDSLNELKYKENAYQKQIEELNEAKNQLEQERQAQEAKLADTQKKSVADIRQAQQEKDDALYRIKQQQKQVNNLLNDLIRAQTSLKQAKDKQIGLENMMRFSESQKHDYLKKITSLEQEISINRQTQNHSQQKIDKLNSDLSKAQDELRNQQDELRTFEKLFDDYGKAEVNYKNKIDQLTATQQELSAQIAKLSAQKAAQEAILNGRTEKLATKMQSQWRVYFPRVSCDYQFLKKVAEYNFYTRLALEEVLRNLNYAPDPKALSIGKLNNSDIEHSKVMGNKYRLCWRFSNDKNKIVLLKFGTHAEVNRYYQKRHN